MKSVGNLVVATTLVICGATAQAQNAQVGNDAGNAAGSAQAQEVNPAKNAVTRYSAGDSIPLGFSPAAQKHPALPASTAKASQVTRYSAGDSIPLGALPPAQKRPVEETIPAKISPPENKMVRYSAGDSIVLAYPSASPASVQAGAPAQQKSTGYSGAAGIPLAGALGDSVTTHIGMSQAGLSEANGLINTSPAGLVGLFVVKAGLVYYFENQKPQVRTAGLKTAAGVWGGFTMNNLLLIAGSTNPVSLVGGALFGAYMFHRQGITLDKEAASKAVPGVHAQAR